MAIEPTEKEKARVLRAFVTACDQGDYAWVYAANALYETGVTRAERATIKALREEGLLKAKRGGVDEDGRTVGGSGYAATRKGRLWLEGVENQQELPL